MGEATVCVLDIFGPLCVLSGVCNTMSSWVVGKTPGYVILNGLPSAKGNCALCALR